MKTLVLLVCAVVSSSAFSFSQVVHEEWLAFKMEHNKQYHGAMEEWYRMRIYAMNKLNIAKHNQMYEQGLVSFKMAENQYADMLHQEFVDTMTGYKGNLSAASGASKKTQSATFIPAAHVAYPANVDWTEMGAVTEVKHQGYHCGSCWAFGTTGSMEGQQYRKTGRLVSLSEQNLVDCSSAYGNKGCGGGYMENSFTYIKENGGIDTEKTYPYEGIQGQCRYNPKNSGAVSVGYVSIPSGDEKKLLQAVATVGPVSVYIDASQKSFHFYSSGVYFDDKCSSLPTKLHHCVLVVGYGTDQHGGGEYWLVKNSWGRTWGEQGYIRMARNRHNNCGIATKAVYPLV